MHADNESANETRIITPPEKPSMRDMKRGPGVRTNMTNRLPNVVDSPARVESSNAKPTVEFIFLLPSPSASTSATLIAPWEV